MDAKQQRGLEMAAKFKILKKDDGTWSVPSQTGSHLAEMNHSKRFWAHVEHHNPDFRKLDNHLREMWKTVPRWAYRSE
jgi:hypothetical protein